MRRLKELGEFRFIERLRRRLRTDRSVIRGSGDDAAVLRPRAGFDSLITTDMIIEGKHFLRSKATPFQIGWKAMAVNVSDIAAMGGIPRHAVAAVGLPGNLLVHDADEIIRGLLACANKFHVNLVGGDMNASDKLILSVTLLGEVERGRSVRRDGARPGDHIFVTGPLGGSYESGRHLSFIPKVTTARYLAAHFKINSMIDLSDGLASDLKRICEQSGVGAEVNASAIPVAKNPRGLQGALGDGEDFELLFTLSTAEAQRLRRIKKKFMVFYEIGRIRAKWHGICCLGADGRRQDLALGGFDHFRLK